MPATGLTMNPTVFFGKDWGEVNLATKVSIGLLEQKEKHAYLEKLWGRIRRGREDAVRKNSFKSDKWHEV
jgi:hypothetical protein